MKATKRIVAAFFAILMSVTALPACVLPGGSESSGGEAQMQVSTISAETLDGKVANLMSANGIAIQDKNATEVAPMSATTNDNSRFITASAEEVTGKQNKNEFVKETKDGVKDVYFHNGNKGGYKQWNKSFNRHHHKGVQCPHDECDELSDEIETEEKVSASTIVSMNARVNKLYNTGKFTFLCISSAVEGDVKIKTLRHSTMDQLGQTAYGQWGYWLNAEEHFYSEEDHSFCYSFIQASRDGIILVKRSDAETGYHRANYISDDFNQSYIIDNETGKTYSLSQFKHIYSVENGIIHVYEDMMQNHRMYRPEIVNGELQLTQISIPTQLPKGATTSKPLIDIHGNVVFTGRSKLEGADEYGEVKQDGVIFTGYSELVQQRLPRVTQELYVNMNRYHMGSDGQIYRVHYQGNMNNLPVHVLNAQGEWENPSATANVQFMGAQGWLGVISPVPSYRQYLLMTEISNGKIYFANAFLGSEAPFTVYTSFELYARDDYGFVGIMAMGVDGTTDTAMQAFMEQAKNTSMFTNANLFYRVGNTAFAYEDKNAGELVIWDRKTETQQRIKSSALVEGEGFTFTDKHLHCFQAHTVNGVYYVLFNEKEPAKAWTEYSQTLPEKAENLDAYYQFIQNK